MRKFIVILAVTFVLALGAYFIVKYYWFPRYMAHMIVDETEIPKIFPEKVRKKIIVFRRKVNPIAETIISEASRTGVTLEQILEFIDNVDSDLVFQLADSLSKTTIYDTNKVFSMGKNMLKPKFNAELFRDKFNQLVTKEMIRSGIKHYNLNREELMSSPEVGRLILRQILIEKEKQIQNYGK